MVTTPDLDVHGDFTHTVRLSDRFDVEVREKSYLASRIEHSRNIVGKLLLCCTICDSHTGALMWLQTRAYAPSETMRTKALNKLLRECKKAIARRLKASPA